MMKKNIQILSTHKTFAYAAARVKSWGLETGRAGRAKAHIEEDGRRHCTPTVLLWSLEQWYAVISFARQRERLPM